MNAMQFIKYAATFAGGAYAQHKLTQQQVYRDPAFLAILDVALQDVPESDIAQLVHLSPNRLRDWAMAPKAMRPALLAKWDSEPEANLAGLTENIGQLADDIEVIRTKRKAERSAKWKKELKLIGWFALVAFGIVILVIMLAPAQHPPL